MFLVFAGDLYYPYGGYNDIVAQMSTKEQAIKAMESWLRGKSAYKDTVWAHVVDYERWTIVAHWNGMRPGKQEMLPNIPFPE